MRVAVFSTRTYDLTFFDAANAAHGHEIQYFKAALEPETAPLAAGFAGVCVFVNDRLNVATLERLAAGGTNVVALRCAGYNNVDLKAAEALGIAVARVPAYSPHAISEHTIGLLQALNRKICHAWDRVREGNFSLDGLVGRDLHGKTIGIVGTGQIGGLVARAFRLGFDCKVLAHDLYPDANLEAIGVRYVEIEELLAQSDVISLHCPLTPATRYLINAESLAKTKPNLLLVNTGRGALIDTKALIAALKAGRIGGVALDVYEQEEGLFFEDLSHAELSDKVFRRLLTFPNVLVTGHQAFLTEDALTAIAETTLKNLADAESGTIDPANAVRAAALISKGTA